MFKKCAVCGKVWNNPAEFLADPLIKYHGYQATFDDPMKGLFLFSHLADSCHTTLAMKVDLFSFMMPTSKGTIPMNTDSKCQGLCLQVSNDQPCEVVNCVGNRIRHLIGQIKEYPKNAN